MNPTFTSHGKLLLTGEYAVLGGAKALALPLKKGSSLSVLQESGTSETFLWKTLINGQTMFEATVKKDGSVSAASDAAIAHNLTMVLRAFLNQVGSDFFVKNEVKEVLSTLDFPMTWGLGSSSTLINNLALWGEINAYALLDATFQGSGYDIACAQAARPIMFKISEGRRRAEEIMEHLPFSDRIWFIYLGTKKNSREAISEFVHRQSAITEEQINSISDLTDKILFVKDFLEFRELISEHERIIGQMMGLNPIGPSLFPDFEGTIKSLGAWGGDFILAAGDDVSSYFRAKGYDVIFSYNELVL